MAALSMRYFSPADGSAVKVIRVRTFGHCGDCQAQMKAQRQEHLQLEKIGREVHDPESLTVYSAHQCLACGELWQRIEDRDPGSEGAYLSPLAPYDGRNP